VRIEVGGRGVGAYRFQTADCLVLPLFFISLGDDGWDVAASCTVAVNRLHLEGVRVLERRKSVLEVVRKMERK
jgi:hypothetical protein